MYFYPQVRTLSIGSKKGSGVNFEKWKKEGGSFPVKVFQGLSFLHLEITLPFAKFCHAFEEKKISITIIL